jgi:deazaflavin-dependent oxidoreductase (nitroreductase family)
MAFEKTPAGTRGTNMPSFVTPVMKFMNNQMIRRFRRSGGKAAGMDGLVLTTVGAKTGQRRQTLLGTFPDGDDAWLVVASAGGATKNPAWYHNLAAHPDQAQIEVGGKTVDVTATQLAGQERDAAWQRITAAQPRYAGYEKKTDRVLPVIRLTAS